ncbi:peptidyl-prolyl cis-trans isomerase, EpsD family [Rhodocyclus tenuis]|uniref:Peptidyl-prolyl cis-trans isomerase, EpsD family n=1 Tax=Rhodocyclus tenuis TaxID=1066 RepID=A0A6L5JW55_RHOTE|nr:EpsD family peptidyl-prolyl cis-trans isomerase [Rhodocyclus gracilis]MQY51022.1 peptidyl-prolyl cis-trans isomerase, EpsD family [Rhodocyclus gracilis]MRD73001.1 peptidyl-prolyl cis-trans isomerase, EpsD family [Rhodocyclus gracilis]
MPIRHASRPAILTLSVLVLALAACNDDKKAGTQVAAKVNKEEISVHQVNDALARAGNLPPEQVKAASRQVLDHLIDQELLVQKGIDQKIDRDPQVMKAIEATRREIIARATLESTTANAPKATAAEVSEFYTKRPELFSERRIFNLQELTIAATPNLVPRLQEQLGKAKSLGDIAAWLKSENIPFAADNTTKAAEQLPLDLLPRFHQMKDGQIAVIPARDGVLVTQLLASRSMPLDLKAATPFIQQFLNNQKKIDLSNNEIKQLRQQAKIELVGEFATPLAAAAPTAANDGKPVTPPTANAAPTAGAPAATQSASTAPTGSTPDGSTIAAGKPTAASASTAPPTSALPSATGKTSSNAAAMEKGMAGLK